MTIHNRFPKSNILGQRGHWDEATCRVVLDRVNNVPPFTHFGEHQRATLQALCDRVMPQSWKAPERRVPIAPWIDRNCSRKIRDGFRFDDMPDDATAWDWGLEGLDQIAQAMFEKSFVELEGEKQDRVLEALRAGNPPGQIWQQMPAKRWWTFLALRQITGVYYAHPFAWDEIGFGGPAYPRGYSALNFGAPEPWEAREDV